MIKKILLIAVTLSFGCVHYNAAEITALSNKNLAAEAVTQEMCEDFSAASLAATEGDDVAFPLLGKAYEIKNLSTGLQQHGSQCVEVVKRLNKEVNPMSEVNHMLVLDLFKKSWNNAKTLVSE